MSVGGQKREVPLVKAHSADVREVLRRPSTDMMEYFAAEANCNQGVNSAEYNRPADAETSTSADGPHDVQYGGGTPHEVDHRPRYMESRAQAVERRWNSSNSDTYRSVRSTQIVEHSTQQARPHPCRLCHEHAGVHWSRSPNPSITATGAHVVARPRGSVRMRTLLGIGTARNSIVEQIAFGWSKGSPWWDNFLMVEIFSNFLFFVMSAPYGLRIYTLSLEKYHTIF